MLILNSNNIYQLNLSSWRVPSDTIVLDVSKNNLTQIDLPSVRNCSLPSNKISVFGDNNKLSRIVLPCSNTQQYDTVSLTNNELTDINSILPNVLVQQCSIQTLNLSGNYFKSWNSENLPFQYYLDRNILNENRTHHIKSLDMTHCRMEYIDYFVFSIYTIQFLDLRENAIHTVPFLIPDMFYPSVLDVEFNPVKCNCQMLWLKFYLLYKETSKRENEILVTTCMEPLWNTSMDIVTVPNIMFMCDTECPQQIHEQCNKADRCYQAYFPTAIDAAICLASHNDNNKLSSAFITVSYQLYISGFNLTTLELPYVRPHNLTHLNLTSCNISVIPETAFINIPQLRLLVLAHNAIQNLLSSTFNPLVWLEYLDLSHNKLLTFDRELIVPLFLLKTVYIHDNKMTQMSLDTLEEFKILQNLSLYDNPWVCDCNDTFGHWIVKQQSKDILLSPENITCSGTDVPVMYSNITCTTKIHVHHGSKAATVVSCVLGSISIVVLTVCILIYKYRSTLSVLAFIYMPRCTRKRTEHDGVSGVFAIYVDQERGARVWIKDSLIPFIEYACPLICYDRDFIIGEDMADNIQDAVEKSNCAIVLLSRRFMQNSWSCCMFQAAFSEMREKKRPYKIILILTPDVTVNMLRSDENCPQDLRVMLKTQRLVYMSHKFYHETLLYMLPESCRTMRQIMAVRGEDIITIIYKLRLILNMLKMLSKKCSIIHLNPFSKTVVVADSNK